jgi:hypothetical protein
MVVYALTPLAAHAQSGPSPDATVSYVRVGLGVVPADSVHIAPAVGFGIRAEVGALAIDVSFFDVAIHSAAYETSASVLAGSIVKVEALRFVSPTAARTPYFGGGLGLGIASVGRQDPGGGAYASSWEGSGLQAELTAGYEAGRSSDLRLFVQADLALPVFATTSARYSYGTGSDSIQRRYVPSVAVSLGVGWKRWRH